ncbi:MAG: aspartate aminotransferase family protein [Proteobacteria bacterium]|nr:aspartate aminotransferase family protein [Pseudomonadota bacterium]
MPTYGRADVAFERGEGAYLFDTEGRRYLDFGSGIAVTSLGHAHPALVRALTGQASKLWHTSNLYNIPGQQRLAERLVANTFADTVFFGNSGAEAVECSIKVARKYHSAAGNPERFRIVTFEGAFHGRTLATLAAGRQEKHLAGFGPVVDGFDQVPFGDLGALRTAITSETAAILVEPIQGESGIRVFPEGFLAALRKIADDAGLLLMLDEIQCGMGRTGRLFAHEWSGVTPDVMAVAKALGGGFPIGACLATEKAAAGMTAGTHGSTFGGNPLGAAVANAVLDEMLADGFLANVEAVGARLRAGLDRLAQKHGNKIAEVRGQGLMLGLRCHGDNMALIKALLNKGLLTIVAGDQVVRLLPPLIIGDSEVDEALTILDDAIGSLAS